jgi:molybdopterin/thiamine biosynthesis adenylyltransferase
MLKLQITHRSDITLLLSDGYDIEIRDGLLLVHDVPHVNSNREVKYGVLISKLLLAGDIVQNPEDHIAYFIGEYPCNANGSPITALKHGNQNVLTADIIANYSFSNKPPEGFSNYYDKMVSYINILLSQAQVINVDVTARHYRPIQSDNSDSPFCYIDMATIRANIKVVSDKLAQQKIGIIGLGGTGSYILDFVAKTQVSEIHLFDGDYFLTHNAFRAPGAASLSILREKPKKVAYFHSVYSEMHHNIVKHDSFIDGTNLEELVGLDFIFISIDKGSIKKLIIEKLCELGIPFIDVGMQVDFNGNQLDGFIRMTASTPEKREHIKSRIPVGDERDNDEYKSNIQISELNALNAILAVIKWKQLFGFYIDESKMLYNLYHVATTKLICEDS